MPQEKQVLTFREKPHTKLRILLDCYGITGKDLAELFGRTEKYVSERMCAKQPWTIEEIYTIADNLNSFDPDSPPLPYQQISEYFPAGGRRNRSFNAGIRKI